jgi:hypothetical protein
MEDTEFVYKKGLRRGFIRGANTAVVILGGIWILHTLTHL